MATGFLISYASAQEAAGAGQAARSAPEEEKAEGKKLPEAEFVTSPSFRSGSLVQPLWRDLSFDGHYFGGNENNVGFTGGSWTFHGEHWKVAPGFGVSFGDNRFRTMPALSVRWGFERTGSLARAYSSRDCSTRRLLRRGLSPNRANLRASPLCLLSQMGTTSVPVGSA